MYSKVINKINSNINNRLNINAKKCKNKFINQF